MKKKPRRRPRIGSARPPQKVETVRKPVSTHRKPERQPRADQSNRALCCFLKVSLTGVGAGGQQLDDGYRPSTWDEIVEELGWSGKWERDVHQLAEQLGYL